MLLASKEYLSKVQLGYDWSTIIEYIGPEEEFIVEYGVHPVGPLEVGVRQTDGNVEVEMACFREQLYQHVNQQ